MNIELTETPNEPQSTQRSLGHVRRPVDRPLARIGACSGPNCSNHGAIRQQELAKGKSSEMKAMAKQIIAAQNKEIGQFDRWLAKQK